MIIAFIVKILVVMLGLIVISKTYLDYRKKHEGLVMFLFWTLAWIGIIVLALKPTIYDAIIIRSANRRIGIGTFLGAFSVFLFFVTYRIYNKANKLEQQMKEIVTKIGLKGLEDKN